MHLLSVVDETKEKSASTTTAKPQHEPKGKPLIPELKSIIKIVLDELALQAIVYDVIRQKRLEEPILNKESGGMIYRDIRIEPVSKKKKRMKTWEEFIAYEKAQHEKLYTDSSMSIEQETSDMNRQFWTEFLTGRCTVNQIVAYLLSCSEVSLLFAGSQIKSIVPLNILLDFDNRIMQEFQFSMVVVDSKVAVVTPYSPPSSSSSSSSSSSPSSESTPSKPPQPNKETRRVLTNRPRTRHHSVCLIELDSGEEYILDLTCAQYDCFVDDLDDYTDNGILVVEKNKEEKTHAVVNNNSNENLPILLRPVDQVKYMNGFKVTNKGYADMPGWKRNLEVILQMGTALASLEKNAQHYKDTYRHVKECVRKYAPNRFHLFSKLEPIDANVVYVAGSSKGHLLMKKTNASNNKKESTEN